MNIALIGMPTCGKSTVGVVLAKMLGMNFVDSDILIQNEYNSKLSDLIKRYGTDGFIDIESKVIQNINLTNTVIATGGSAVYSNRAIMHLKDISKVVYLKVPLESIKKRMNNMRTRGVVIEDGKTLDDLFLERKSLYEKYADFVVDETGKSLEETVNSLVKLFN